MDKKLEYSENMKILLDEKGGKAEIGRFLIDVGRNRAVIAEVWKDGDGRWTGWRLPVMFIGFAASTQYIHPYMSDHVASEYDRDIIVAALNAKEEKPPFQYFKYHLFTEDEYGKLSESEKKEVCYLEKASGEILYMS